MNLVNRINAFSKLGEILRNPDPEKFHLLAGELGQLQTAIETVQHHNGWFIPEFVRYSLKSISANLKWSTIEKWVKNYDLSRLEPSNPRSVGVVMAGNIPLVGFYDYLSVLISGHQIHVKLSSDDNVLLPIIHKILVKIEPKFAPRVTFQDGPLKNIDAIIATGSNNTARYFEYYFSRYPHIIRKNRNSIAIITGKESPEELQRLADDIFLYFGLGCRNVSKIFVPENYKFDLLFEAMQKYVELIHHTKYRNNYDFYKSVYLVNKTSHIDTGFLLLKEDEGLSSPVAVLFYSYYKTLSQVKRWMDEFENQIQCIVSVRSLFPGKKTIPPGSTQQPELWDYADNVDTLDFLTRL